MAWLASGSCVPNVYTYQYTLTNSEGYSAVPVNVTVQIYEQVTNTTSHVLNFDSCCVLIVLCTWSSVLQSLMDVIVCRGMEKL